MASPSPHDPLATRHELFFHTHLHFPDSATIAFMCPPQSTIFPQDFDLLPAAPHDLILHEPTLLPDTPGFDSEPLSCTGWQLENPAGWILDELSDIPHDDNVGLLACNNMQAMSLHVAAVDTTTSPHHTEDFQETSKHDCDLSSSPQIQSGRSRVEKLGSKTAAPPCKHRQVQQLQGDNGRPVSRLGKLRRPSKNLYSERKRRRKLNDKLYSLRALVPQISKMDKASIVADAIDYLKSLCKKVEDLRDDIVTLQAKVIGDASRHQNFADGSMATVISPRNKIDYKILEVDVVKLEEDTYHLKVICMDGHGILVKLTKALETLSLEVVNASLMLINDHILSTIIVKATGEIILEPSKLRAMFLDVVPNYGLDLVSYKKEREIEIERC